MKQLQPHSVLHSVFVKPSGNQEHEVGKSPPKVRSVATATNSAWSILNRYCPQNVRWQSSSSLKPVCLHTSVHASRNPFKNNRDKSDCVQAKLKFAAKNAVPMTQRLFLAVFEPSQQVASNAAIALFPAKKKGGFQNAMRCPDLKKKLDYFDVLSPSNSKKNQLPRHRSLCSSRSGIQLFSPVKVPRAVDLEKSRVPRKKNPVSCGKKNFFLIL